MLGRRILQTNESFGGGGMSLVAWALPVILLHDFIEVASGVLVSLGNDLL